MATLERRPDLGRGLEAELRARLDRGEHAAVAALLAGSDRHAEAGWVLEQIWDFAGAGGHYLAAGLLVDALRAAIEDGGPRTLADVYAALEARADPALCREAADLLQRRRKHEDAARVLAWAEANPREQAAAMARAGDRLTAARLLADAGQPREALEALGPPELGGSDAHTSLAAAPEHALAAALCWDLGDAEGTARHAQEARRSGALDGEIGRQVRRLLARALSSLGHDLAAQLILSESDEDQPEHQLDELQAHGRYRVTGVLPAPYSGAAYVGVDRVTLQEVEIHLLLAEFGDMDRPGPAVHQALERFAAIAEAAQALAHPAIRPILRLDPRVGLLVMPRREGPILRDLVRAPGMATVAGPRARSLIAFLLDALATAHGVGLVHGSLLPSQITCDALGRPTLGPFGAYHLAGLVATRTGGLEELLASTPPEQRAGETPQQAGDLYMLGALWAALLAGRFDDPHVLLEELEERGVLPEDEAGEIERWLATDPAARPAAREARQRLDVPVSDLSKLAGVVFDPGESMRAAKALDRRLGRALTVVAADSWSDELLDRLCATRNPWLQNILDRDGRVFQLAAWPAGCRRLEADNDWRAQVHPLAMTLLAPSTEPNAPEALAGRQSGEWDDDSDRTLREAVAARIDGEAIVITAAGERMLALDRLLLR